MGKDTPRPITYITMVPAKLLQILCCFSFEDTKRGQFGNFKFFLEWDSLSDKHVMINPSVVIRTNIEGSLQYNLESGRGWL